MTPTPFDLINDLRGLGLDTVRSEILRRELEIKALRALLRAQRDTVKLGTSAPELKEGRADG